MGKTNIQRACGLALLAACGRTLTHQAMRIAKALDKAERRGAKKACIMCCKPAPQVDAEKVKALIIGYGKYRTACANTKSFVPDDCAAMQTTYRKLLSELGIK